MTNLSNMKKHLKKKQDLNKFYKILINQAAGLPLYSVYISHASKCLVVSVA